MPPYVVPGIIHSSGRSLEVVLAGNHIPSRQDLINLLKQKGLEPVAFSSVNEAQSLLDCQNRVLAICHAGSSKGPFRDLLGAVGKGSKVPLIVCGDFYDRRLDLEATDLGAFDCFTSPFHSDVVDWVVRNALQEASEKAETSGGPAPAMNERVPCG